MANLILLIHLSSTWYLIGLCWLVQRVQYPLMDRVGEEGFARYEEGHVTRIGPVVAPMMLLELATGLLLLTLAGPSFRGPIFLSATGLLVVIWLSTFLLQVPLHGQLSGGFDASAHASLVRSNWIRTLAWTIRGGLLLFLVWERIEGAGA